MRVLTYSCSLVPNTYPNPYLFDILRQQILIRTPNLGLGTYQTSLCVILSKKYLKTQFFLPYFPSPYFNTTPQIIDFF